MLSETKFDKSFPVRQYIISSFVTPFKLSSAGYEKALVYMRKGIPGKLLNSTYSHLFAESLCESKCLLLCLCSQFKNNIYNYLNISSKTI